MPKRDSASFDSDDPNSDWDTGNAAFSGYSQNAEAILTNSDRSAILRSFMRGRSRVWVSIVPTCPTQLSDSRVTGYQVDLTEVIGKDEVMVVIRPVTAPNCEPIGTQKIANISLNGAVNAIAYLDYVKQSKTNVLRKRYPSSSCGKARRELCELDNFLAGMRALGRVVASPVTT